MRRVSLCLEGRIVIVRLRRRMLGAMGFYAARNFLRLRAFRRQCRRRGTRIHRRARVYGINRITIGDNGFIDADAILSTTAPYSGSGLIESRGEIVLGDRCVVLSGCVVACFGGSVRFGDDVTLNTHAVLLATGGITIGSKTKIAPHVTIVGETHRFASADIPIMEQGMTGQGVNIGSDVWIGAGAKILDGVTVADGAVVGAGAVVTRSVDAYSVVAGVPARRIGARTPGDSPSPAVFEGASGGQAAAYGAAQASKTA